MEQQSCARSDQRGAQLESILDEAVCVDSLLSQWTRCCCADHMRNPATRREDLDARLLEAASIDLVRSAVPFNSDIRSLLLWCCVIRAEC